MPRKTGGRPVKRGKNPISALLATSSLEKVRLDSQGRLRLSNAALEAEIKKRLKSGEEVSVYVLLRDCRPLPNILCYQMVSSCTVENEYCGPKNNDCPPPNVVCDCK